MSKDSARDARDRLLLIRKLVKCSLSGDGQLPANVHVNGIPNGYPWDWSCSLADVRYWRVEKFYQGLTR